MKESFKITALVGIQKLDKFGKLGTRDPHMFDMKWLIGCFKKKKKKKKRKD